MKMKTLLLTAMTTLGITAASTAQNVPSYLPTDGLVGWWPFNGNANDESGNGNDGLVNGATLVSDRFGVASSAFSLDGVNDKIEYTNCGIGVGSENFTICFNFKSNDLNGAGHFLNTGGRTVTDFHIYYLNNVLYVGTYNSFTNQTSIPFVNYLNNNWHSIVISWDGTSMITYLNNTIMATITPPYSATDPTMTLGEDGGNYCNFDIDDIAIYNRVLTSQEISALYTATSSNNNESSNTTANVPGAISYQAVARDTQGAPLADTNVQVQFTLIADSLSGAEEYVETHTLTTNSLGLFTTSFGGGTPVSNSFDSINWSAGNKFLNVQIDTGNGLVDIGTQQLLSTPYSLHSATAGAIKNPGLPIYSDNAAALAGGLSSGDMYRTGAGVLMVVY
jgi:hypothetical protein